MQRSRQSVFRLGFLAGAVVLGAVALAPRVAHAGGRIVVSDVEFGSFGSEKEMNAALKRQAKTTLKGDGAWNLNLMVFLGAGAGTQKINIVYYDMSKKPPEQVSFTEVGVKADQKIVQLNGQAISKEMGFVKGHKYEIRATRLVGGKEKVYAKTTITLK
ncbi:MAG TPA: hypothetical protein VIK30_02570 [Polyangia bacterium]